MSIQIPKTFKSIIYSRHDAEDPTGVLSIQSYTPKEDLEDSIVLRTLAFPINPSDINQLMGVYPSFPEKTLDYQTKEPSAIAGNEGLFEVIHLPKSGSSSTNVGDLKVGDWVIPLQANQGTWSNYKVFKDASDLIKVNPLDFYTAATVCVNGVTAYQLVNNYVDWDPSGNEWIIQNAGTSGVSKFVTQIAKAKGIKTLSVIRDRDDFDAVANTLEHKFGATKVISETQNSDELFCKEELPKILGANARVRLALNSVCGKSSTSIAEKLENNALMLTFGCMSNEPVTLPASLHIFKGLTSAGFWVTALNKKHPEKKRESVRQFIKLYESGNIISPKDEIETVTWDTTTMSDDEVLQAVRDSIIKKGKKQMVILKW